MRRKCEVGSCEKFFRPRENAASAAAAAETQRLAPNPFGCPHHDACSSVSICSPARVCRGGQCWGTPSIPPEIGRDASPGRLPVHGLRSTYAPTVTACGVQAGLPPVNSIASIASPPGDLETNGCLYENLASTCLRGKILDVVPAACK